VDCQARSAKDNTDRRPVKATTASTAKLLPGCLQLLSRHARSALQATCSRFPASPKPGAHGRPRRCLSAAKRCAARRRGLRPGAGPGEPPPGPNRPSFEQGGIAGTLRAGTLQHSWIIAATHPSPFAQIVRQCANESGRSLRLPLAAAYAPGAASRDRNKSADPAKSDPSYHWCSRVSGAPQTKPNLSQKRMP